MSARRPHHRPPDRCPRCGGQSDCLESRPAPAWTRRRYRCRGCGQRWTTREVLVRVDGEPRDAVVTEAGAEA